MLKQIHIKLPEALHRELKIQAVIRGQTLQEYVVAAINEKLKLEKPLGDQVAEERTSYNAESE